jgi:hypothetical protein
MARKLRRCSCSIVRSVGSRLWINGRDGEEVFGNNMLQHGNPRQRENPWTNRSDKITSDDFTYLSSGSEEIQIMYVLAPHTRKNFGTNVESRFTIGGKTLGARRPFDLPRYQTMEPKGSILGSGW